MFQASKKTSIISRPFHNQQHSIFTPTKHTKNMADEIYDSTRSGTAKENIPTMSNPMDNIHGNVEDISNRASGYKVMRASFLPPSFFLSPPPPSSVNRCHRARRADHGYRPSCIIQTPSPARRRMRRRCLRSWGARMRS